MEHTMSDQHVDIIATAPNWVTTALTTVGAGLITILLVWIASNQVEIGKTQAVILVNQDNQSRQLNLAVETQRDQLISLAHSVNTIWPRLRAQSEGIEILKREIENITGKKIELPDPEKF